MIISVVEVGHSPSAGQEMFASVVVVAMVAEVEVEVAVVVVVDVAKQGSLIALHVPFSKQVLDLLTFSMFWQSTTMIRSAGEAGHSPSAGQVMLGSAVVVVLAVGVVVVVVTL